ncbi:hypothetical protein [Hymenobacter sp.]|jgi:hypothetical protein|uniref:hypothetical protein n=1 Tax=Hymenobacter sp. TaxID=1898978 RepID=UPI002ED998FE
MTASSKASKYIVGVFFGLLLLLGISLHRDYGVSWDEPTDHQNGAVNGRYVAELLFPDLLRGHPTLATIPPLANYADNDHGVLFELPAAALGLLLTPGDSQGYYFLRHLLIFCTFVLGIWALYKLGSVYFNSWQLGLLVALLLVLSPRMFAEAFFNGKDIPFMVCFTLGIYTLAQLLAYPTWLRALAHALATAAAIDIRVPGVLLVAFTAGMVALEVLWPTEGRQYPRRHWLGLSAVYLGATGVFVVAGWPALWADPFTHFRMAYQSMSHFNWPTKTIYYLGHYEIVDQLPWHYIPVWVISTSPLLYVAAALVGLVASLSQAYAGGKAWLTSSAGRLDLLLAGWLFGPGLIVVVLHSVVYNGWRHLYFIYPALLLWAVRGLVFIIALGKSRYKAWQLGVVGLVVVELFHIAWQMTRLHPYEHLYFSTLPPDAVERLLERDYWALSYRQGLEWIAAHDTASQITINPSNRHPLYNNTLILNPATRARFRYQPNKEARYFITNYRRHPQSYLDSMGTEVYVIRAGGIKILSVFRQP